MKPRMLLLAFAAGMLWSPAAMAAPVPDDTKNPGPTIALQVRAVEDLLTTFKTVTKNFLPDALYKEFERDALSKLDLSVLKGIDTKKAAGLYATIGDGILAGDLSKSSIVAIVPVTDEKDFVALFSKIDLMPEKRDDVYIIPIPNAPIAASMRFLKGYAYIGIAGERLDPKLLLDPREVISDKETAAAVLRIRIDRIPEDLKKHALEFVSGIADQAKDQALPAEVKPVVSELITTGIRWLKMGVLDGKELVLRLDLDPKSGAFIQEYTLEGKSSSALAKSFAAMKPTKNDFAHIIGSDSAAHAVVQTPLFIEDLRSILVSLIDLGAAESVKNVPADQPKESKELMVEMFAALKRTVKDGNLDLAASLRGPDKNEQYTAVGAVSVKDSAPLEKAIKAFLKTTPEKKEVAERVKVDSYKIGAVNVHEILVVDDMPPNAQKIFSKSNVHVAFAPDALYVTFGANAKGVMEEVVAAKITPKPMPLVHAEISGKRLMPLIKNTGAPTDGPAGQFFDKFAKLDRLPILTVKVDGGDKLVVRQEIGLLPIVGMFGVRTIEAVPAMPPQAVPRAK